MITEGLNVAKVKKVGKIVEIITVDDDGQYSTWFCDFGDNKPELGKKILISKFQITSVKVESRYPVKTKILKWEYFKD